MRKTHPASRIAGAIAIGFGLLTIASGGSTLFGGLDMGRVVGFVLWFNTLAGIAYVVAGVGLWQGRGWAFALALTLFAATVLVFAALGLHIAQGGAYEIRTVFAMTLRSAVWGAIAFVAHRTRSTQHRG